MTVEVDTKTLKSMKISCYITMLYKKDGELLGERFRILKRLLDDLGY